MERTEEPKALREARRCLAKTRRGTACQSPAMPNGRCRLHGGLSRGAPGNQNALKHGMYSQAAIETRREAAAIRREWREIDRLGRW
ncbi:HGGxSTG domain-containing protein [Sphingomonas hankookensis]